MVFADAVKRPGPNFFGAAHSRLVLLCAIVVPAELEACFLIVGDYLGDLPSAEATQRVVTAVCDALCHESTARLPLRLRMYVYDCWHPVHRASVCRCVSVFVSVCWMLDPRFGTLSLLAASMS